MVIYYAVATYIPRRYAPVIFSYILLLELLQSIGTIFGVSEESSVSRSLSSFCSPLFFCLTLGLSFTALSIHLLLTFLGYAGFLWREIEEHLLAFQCRHLLHLAIFLKIVGETQQQNFSLLLEKDRTATEEHESTKL